MLSKPSSTTETRASIMTSQTDHSKTDAPPVTVEGWRRKAVFTVVLIHAVFQLLYVEMTTGAMAASAASPDASELIGPAFVSILVTFGFAGLVARATTPPEHRRQTIACGGLGWALAGGLAIYVMQVEPYTWAPELTWAGDPAARRLVLKAPFRAGIHLAVGVAVSGALLALRRVRPVGWHVTWLVPVLGYLSMLACWPAPPGQFG